MTTRNLLCNRSWLAVGAFALATTSVGSAWAHDDPDDNVKVSETTSRPAEKVGPEEEPKFALGIDLVVGFGKETVVTQELPGSLATLPTNVIEAARVHDESFILSGWYDATKNMGFGVRLPFTFGSIDPATRDARGTTALGAIELEAEYAKEIAPHMEAMGTFGITLPTAQGDAPPSAADLAGSQATLNQTSLDRYFINRMAAASRGWADNALYTPKTFGLIPRIGVKYKQNKLTLEPYAKYEALISTVAGADHSFQGELVLGARGGYRVLEKMEVGARVWTTIPLGGADTTAVGVVEPEVRGHFGGVEPYAGVILPFAGPLTDPYFVGIRVGVMGRF